LEALIGATGAVEDAGAVSTARGPEAGGDLGGLFTYTGARPNEFAKFLAMLGHAARKTRLPSDFESNWKLAEADARAAQPSPAASSSPPPPPDAVKVIEKLAERTIVPTPEEAQGGTMPAQKAKSAWEMKMQELRDRVEKYKHPENLKGEDCLMARKQMEIIYNACMKAGGQDDDPCIPSDRHPCTP
jgi:hypothetical protein